MNGIWTIADRRGIATVFAARLAEVAEGDCEAMIWVIDSMGLESALTIRVPSMGWSERQIEVLTQAIALQVPSLIARARMGDIAAFRALSLAHGRSLIGKGDETFGRLIQGLEAGIDERIIEGIKALLRAAMAGDHACTKAAADWCHQQGYSVQGENIDTVLPEGVTIGDLEALVASYEQNAPIMGLPRLIHRFIEGS